MQWTQLNRALLVHVNPGQSRPDDSDRADFSTPFPVLQYIWWHVWWRLCAGVNVRLAPGSLASITCYLVEPCRWEMSSACPYHPLSLASAQTKNTFTNIHLPCPACMLTLFILADPYVQCTRTASDGELKGLYDRWLGKTTGGWVALYTAFFQRPRPARRAAPLGSACLGESEREKLKNTLIWCHGLFHQPPAHWLKGSLCLHSGQLERSTLQKTLW